jgi:hypothetical protein
MAAGLGAIVGHLLIKINEVGYWLCMSISHVATLIVTPAIT